MGQLSEKVDVYSFGVLLLEIVSGRSNIDTRLPTDKIYLLDYVSLRPSHLTQIFQIAIAVYILKGFRLLRLRI